MELTRFGVWTSFQAIGEENAGAAAKVAERLGYGTFWVGGSPRLSSLAPLLAATETLTVATSIVNVWEYEPADLAAEFQTLERAFPGRVLVGIGVGHPEATRAYEKPLTKLRGFLDGIDRAAEPIPAERMILAALGPRMLELAAERSLGTIPYFTTADHTAYARERVPAPKLVAPELAVVLDEDAERAGAAARAYAGFYLGLSNYTGNLLRFGFDETDLENGGSDRLIDAVVPQGSAEHLVGRVRAHLDAGADHVCLQVLGVDGVPQAAWTELAGALGL